MVLVEERAVASRPSTAPADSRENHVAVAIRRAVAYADVFDWPLTVAEVHRSLPIPASLAEVKRALDAPASLGLHRSGGLIALAGREPLVARRLRRAGASAVLWRRARPALRIVARLPFVRLVAVTGSLAVDSAERGADVDLFLVTAPGRLWLTRAATILVGRLARARGIRLCPNYLIAESAIALQERDVFTAHELAQMVPIAGAETYRELLARNAWYREFVPNHRPGLAVPPLRPGRVRAFLERLLRAESIDTIERWEMRRKVARLSAGVTSPEQRFDEGACKGHFDEHRRRALARYEARLAEMDPIA